LKSPSSDFLVSTDSELLLLALAGSVTGLDEINVLSGDLNEDTKYLEQVGCSDECPDSSTFLEFEKPG